jgi:CheY-like chemotaxis protein
VILLDLVMPIMDGFRFVTELRSHVEYRNIPVIVVTSKELSHADRTQLEGGVEMVLRKTNARPEEVLGHVRELLETAAKRSGAG